MTPQAPITYRARPDLDDAELSTLHAQAFGGPAAGVRAWRTQLHRHSLSWIGAYAGSELVGFVNVAWDGGLHAFLLDTVVDPAQQHQGIGAELVARAVTEARAAGCEWLHVDYERRLQAFYLDACGFSPTAAGLLALRAEA